MNVSEIIELYINSSAFNNLRSENSKKRYIQNLKIFEKKFGKYSKLKLSQKEFEFELEDFIFSMKKHPRKASYILQVIKIMMNWAKRRGFVKDIRIDNVNFKYKPKKIDNAWTEQDIIFVTENASQYLKDFIFFALETGLRRCDLMNIRYCDIIENYKGQKFIKFQQSKTENIVTIAVSHKLENWLKNHIKTSEYILTSANGEQWTEVKFQSSWGRLRKHLKLKNITPHGLRKTTVRRLAEAGCSVPEIASILGWSLDTAQKMLENHYFTNRMSVALNAIDKLNNMRMSEQNQINSPL